jgi:hypothetical protein
VGDRREIFPYPRVYVYVRQRYCERGNTELLSREEGILSARQQIRLHFRCLVRGRKVGKLAWHLRGIRRALLAGEIG